MTAAAASGAAAASTAPGGCSASIIWRPWLLLGAGRPAGLEVLRADFDPRVDAGHEAARADAGVVLDVLAGGERASGPPGLHDLLQSVVDGGEHVRVAVIADVAHRGGQVGNNSHPDVLS